MKARLNQGFAPVAGRKGTLGMYPISCAHIVVSPYGPDMHVMYCPDHSPCQAAP